MTPLGYFDVLPKATPRKKFEDITYLDSFGQPFKK
jgi:hypothetical protein